MNLKENACAELLQYPVEQSCGQVTMIAISDHRLAKTHRDCSTGEQSKHARRSLAVAIVIFHNRLAPKMP